MEIEEKDSFPAEDGHIEGADIDIEVRAKVIYESDTDDIINQYIIFCYLTSRQNSMK